MPQISILTPVYNGMPYIRECVDSVLAQDFADWELIISDNGSNDGTREYLKTLNDPRIRIFLQEKDLNCYGNCNFLFQQARAPLSQIYCADDYFMDKTCLGQIVRFWEKQPASLGFVRCNWGLNFEKFPFRQFTIQSVPARVSPEESDLYFFLFGSLTGSLTNVSIRTQLVRDCGGFNGQQFPYCGDFDFFSRAGRRAGFALVPDRWLYVRIHAASGGATSGKKGQAVRQVFTLIQDLSQRLKGKCPEFYLKLYATVGYDALQRKASLGVWRKNKSRLYFDEVQKWSASTDCFFGAAGRWLVFLLSCGGKLGLVTVSRRVLHFAKNGA